jgi:DNA-binding transcriptional LysR family regulator
MHFVELKKIRHVIEIAHHGGYAKAANALHITQSALTKSVQSVEARLGLQLLERGPRGITLTPEGERFVQRGSQLIADAEQLEMDAKAVRRLEIGRVRIGVAPASLSLLLSDFLPAFASTHPGVKIESHADAVDSIKRLILHGDLDFAIGAFSAIQGERDFLVEPLASLPVQIFVRRGHPLDRDEPPSPTELAAYPLVGPLPPEPHGSMLRTWAAAAASPYSPPQVMVDDFATILRIVAHSDAYAVVLAKRADQSNFASRYRTWPAWRPMPDLEISILSRSGWRPSHAAARLLQMARSPNADTKRR